ncbi:hypothetical protein D5086_027168, partial [Populus alba]
MFSRSNGNIIQRESSITCFTANVSAAESLLGLEIKVRKQEEDEESSPPNGHVSTPSLRVKSESPSVEGYGPHASEEENQSDSSPSMARFAKPYFVRNLKAQPFSASKGKLKDNRRIGENRKLSLGAKSALRPRAVLSSP